MGTSSLNPWPKGKCWQILWKSVGLLDQWLAGVALVKYIVVSFYALICIFSFLSSWIKTYSLSEVCHLSSYSAMHIIVVLFVHWQIFMFDSCWCRKCAKQGSSLWICHQIGEFIQKTIILQSCRVFMKDRAMDCNSWSQPQLCFT